MSGSRRSAAASARVAAFSFPSSDALAAPRYARTADGPKRPTILNPIGHACASGAFPNTTETPRTTISGE